MSETKYQVKRRKHFYTNLSDFERGQYVIKSVVTGATLCSYMHFTNVDTIFSKSIEPLVFSEGKLFIVMKSLREKGFKITFEKVKS